MQCCECFLMIMSTGELWWVRLVSAEKRPYSLFPSTSSSRQAWLINIIITDDWSNILLLVEIIKIKPKYNHIIISCEMFNGTFRKHFQTSESRDFDEWRQWKWNSPFQDEHLLSVTIIIHVNTRASPKLLFTKCTYLSLNLLKNIYPFFLHSSELLYKVFYLF